MDEKVTETWETTVKPEVPVERETVVKVEKVEKRPKITETTTTKTVETKE